MRRLSAILAAALLLSAASPGADGGPTGDAAKKKPAEATASPAAQAPAPTFNTIKPQGALFLGVLGNDNTGDLTRVGTYDLARQGSLPQFGAQFWGQQGGVRYDVSAFNGGHARDQRYAGSLNVNRYVRANVAYDRFQQRTQHDALDYMDAGLATFIIRHDDTDPGARYNNAHGRLNARLDVTTPGLEGLRFFVSHNQDWRDGHRQSLATSHCANCHTTAYTRGLAERAGDTVAGAAFQHSRLTLEASVSRMTFKDDTPTLTHLYDKAVQPLTTQDIFLNRVSYDSRSGPLPFDAVPESRKIAQRLKARVDLPADATLTGSYTHSRTTNVGLDLGTEFSGGVGRLVVPMGKRATLSASVRRYNIDADDIFVEIAEPVAPAGPTAGLTYQQAYPAMGAIDFVRESTLSRTPTEGEIQFDVRPTRRSSIRAEYGFEQVNRNFSEVEKTTSNRLLVSGRARPAKSLSLRFRAQQTWTDNPFTNRTAAVPTHYQLTPTPGGVPFGGQQYFEMYESRSVDLTSQPTRHFMTDEGITWSPNESVSVSAHYRLRRASNESLNASQWDQTLHMPGAELYIAPGGRVTFTAGYGYQRERTETLFTTLAFVG